MIDKNKFKEDVKANVKDIFNEGIEEIANRSPILEEKEEEEDNYDAFFQTVLDKFGVDSPDELDKDKEKEFYDYIDKNWDSDKEEEQMDEATVEVEIDADGEEDDEEGDEEDEEDEDQMNEALQVVASDSSGGGRMRQDKLTIQNMRELNKLAKTKKYDFFMVTKPNGDEEEYHVDERTGKLVLM